MKDKRKGNQVKKLVIILSIILVTIGCGDRNLMNSEIPYERVYLDNVVLTITEIGKTSIYFEITNNETFSIPQDWANLGKYYVEAYIYTDSTLTNYCERHRVGSSKTLESGETILDVFYYGDCCSKYDDWNYHNTHIDNFRAYQIRYF